MRTLIIDNYDSFTYNLYQYAAELGGNPVVKKNDEILLRDIGLLKPTHIIISPGPGTPEKKRYFGICSNVIKKYMGKIPILGVCLGHQGIIHALGGRIVKAPLSVHGKISEIRIQGRGFKNIFRGFPKKIRVMRYHSLVADRKSLPPDLAVIAETKDGLVMAVQHTKYPMWGVQFHPESISTPAGKRILKNFFNTPKSPNKAARFQ